MNTALVKPSKTIKGMTSMVRTHLDAVERAREIYLAQIKRAEADYFERINRAMGVISDSDDPSSETTNLPTDAPSAENAATP